MMPSSASICKRTRHAMMQRLFFDGLSPNDHCFLPFCNQPLLLACWRRCSSCVFSAIVHEPETAKVQEARGLLHKCLTLPLPNALGAQGSGESGQRSSLITVDFLHR